MVTPGIPIASGTTSVVAALELIPMQFTGGFIELAILFFILAIIAAAVGARGVAGISMTVAKWFIILFIVLAIISLLL